MPRFEEQDPNSALYLGPTGMSDIGDDPLSASDLTPQPPVPMSMQGPEINPYTPTPNANPNMPTFNTESIMQTINKATNNLGSAQDPFYMGKSTIGDFRNPHQQHQFYDRYAAHGDFDDLGFSPFRDNEALYNENSSWWDEMGRASKPMARLAAVAFADAASFGAINDTKTAEQFERQMMVGSSSKGGLAGFTTNLYLNSGYTVGIIAEMLVEEAALLAVEAGLIAATGGTLGAAAPVTGPAMAGTGALMVARGARGFSKIRQGWKMARNLRRTLSNLQDANKARSYWQKTVKAGANFINPLENTTDFLRASNKVDNLGKLAKTTRGFGQFFADVRNIRYAYGESSLEGGMVQNQMERDLLEEFQMKNGRMPTKEEAIEIRNTASDAGVSTAMLNMPVIYLSNKITLDGLLRGRFKNLGADIVDTGVEGKILYNPNKSMKDAYTKLSDGFFSRQWQKIKTPKLALTGMGDYMKANMAEGLQEIAQETIAGWQEDYYTAKFNGDLARGGYYSYLGDNLMKQVSKQGFETFMSGFLMGGPMQVVSRASGKAMDTQMWSDLSMRFKDPQQWAQVKKDREVKLNETVEMLNQFYNDPEKYLSADLINMVEQGEFNKLMTLAEQDGNIQDYYDFKDSAGFKHVATALRFGRFDAHVQNLEGLKDLTAEEIKESYNMSQEEWNKVVDVSVERANQIKARYDLAQESYPNPHNPKKYRDGSLEQVQEALGKTSWDNTIEEMVFNQYSFDRSLQRQESILSKAKDVSGLKNTPYSEFNVMFDLKTASTELDILKKEVDALKGAEVTDPEQKKIVKEKEEQYNKLKAFTDALQEGVTNLTEANKFTEEDYDSIRKAFDEYTQFLGKKNDEYINVKSLNNTFRDIMDYYLLKDRSFRANDAVNAMLDPNRFREVFERNLNINSQLHANRKAEIKKSLEEFMKAMDSNDMLNELYEAGMFFDMKDLVALQKEGKLPDTFYYVNEQGDGKMEVPAFSEDYDKAVQILKKFIPSISNIDIGRKLTDPYNQVGRAKLKNDKRTYQDYAKQFGFDPNAPETKVPLVQVLDAITKSNQATAREKELARKLMDIADKKETVTFVNNASQPGSYTETTQTVIDARWSSADYKQGAEGAALEQVILKQEMHRRAAEALEKDAGFKKEMTALMNEARAGYEALSDEEKTALKDPNARGFEGFATVNGFVAEAMANERFQKFLATVSTTQEPKTNDTWVAFVKKVLRQMQKLLGGKPNGTVLNAAMGAITSKLDTMYTSVTPTAATAPKTTDTTTAPVTPTDDVFAKEDVSDDEWSDFVDNNNVSRLRIITIAEKVKNKEALSEREDAIFKTTDSNPKKDWGGQINKYLVDSAARIPVTKSRETKATLRDLGYTQREIRTMSAGEAWRLAYQGLTKSERTELELADQAAARAELAEQRREIRERVEETVNSAESYGELMEVKTSLLAELQTNPLLRTTAGYNGTEIENLIQARLEQLAFSVKFDDVQEGEVIVLNDGNETLAKVTSKDSQGRFIVVEHLDNPSQEEYIQEDEMEEKVLYRNSEALQNVDIDEDVEVTDEDQDTANETVDTANEILTDPDTVDSILNDPDDSDDWENDINIC